MSLTKEQSAHSRLFVSTYLQRFQQRLIILLGTLLLIIGAGVSYFVFLIKPELWLLTSGGVLLLGAIVIWVATRMLRLYIIQPLEKFQPEQKTAERDQPDQTIKTSEKKYNEPESVPNQVATAAMMEKQNQIETNFRQLVEFSPDGIIIHNQSQIVFINMVGAGLLGVTDPEELIGKPLVDFVHLNYRAQIKARIQQVDRDRKEMPAIEEKLIRLDGTDVEIEMVGIPFTYQNKPAVQLIIRDITERKRAEAELIQRNQTLTILQSAGMAITSRLDLRYVLDTVSEEMTNLLQVESCAIFEWDQAEDTTTMIARYGPEGWWDPKTPAKVYNLADYPLTKWVLEEQIPEQMTISQSNIDPFEYAYMQEMNIKTQMILPMIFQRRVVGLVELGDSRVERIFTYQEISLAKLLANQAGSAIENATLFKQAQQEIIERQRAEASLQEERALLAQRVRERTAELSKANAELARAARLKDEFLAGMSHELRTPLNAILGSAEILQSEVFGPLNEKQIRYLRNSEESGRHLLSLINDILDLSKIEAGKLEIEIGLVAVRSVCEASLRLVKQLAHKKQLKMSSTLDEKVTRMQADERRLKQILVNLLSNAIKFTPEGGQIGLEVAGDAAQEVVHFTVWDTGIGISKEDMARLFQPFVQLDSSLARQYTGTGLGLSLVSRMVELHGGGVSVESEIGQGSRFTAAFPWQEEEITEQKVASEAQTVTPVPAAMPWSTPPLILLAEDNEDNINTILEYLEAQGYRIVIARNGKEAIERAKEEKPNVILMDIQMPEMDGLEATRRLKADAALAKIPVIALTALAMPGDRERCLEAGADEYLSKPVSPKGLVNTINTYLN